MLDREIEGWTWRSGWEAEQRAADPEWQPDALEAPDYNLAWATPLRAAVWDDRDDQLALTHREAEGLANLLGWWAIKFDRIGEDEMAGHVRAAHALATIACRKLGAAVLAALPPPPNTWPPPWVIPPDPGELTLGDDVALNLHMPPPRERAYVPKD